MISIINYGVGNVRAFLNIYDKLGCEAQLLEHPDQFESTTKLILPGVGHFDYAMLKFKEFQLYDAICDHVLNNQMPILGICVGMQMMARRSEEGKEKGLQKAWLQNGTLYVNYEAKNGRVFGMKRANLCYQLKNEKIEERKKI